MSLDRFVINNKKSKLLVCVYWWGRGNNNRNLQTPCEYDYEEGDKLSKPVTYDQMIKKWIAKCEKAGVNYHVKEFPEFAKKGMYQIAINHKPMFCLEALYKLEKMGLGHIGVLYIDGDMELLKYPRIFDIETQMDFIHFSVGDPRLVDMFKPYNPYYLFTSGGCMYFGNTIQGRDLLINWINLTKKYSKKADDKIIELLLNKNKLLLSKRILSLPSEYLWVTDLFGNKPKGSIIVHDACSTSEEFAESQGADSDRVPDELYTYTDKIEKYCQLGKRPNFVNKEETYLNSKFQSNELKHYNKFLSKKGLQKTEYFKKKIVLPKTKDSKNIFVTNDIRGILIAFDAGFNSVIFKNNCSNENLVNKLLIRDLKNFDLIASNINNKVENKLFKEYILKIKKNTPIRINLNGNTAVYHFAKELSETKNPDISKIWNNTMNYIFMMRCKWN